MLDDWDQRFLSRLIEPAMEFITANKATSAINRFISFSYIVISNVAYNTKTIFFSSRKIKL